ncbi:F-box protein At3g58530 [Amaranthus tricolor]|uniref:F-box protein At3g58530 n=1 Tax=Amaranthus tricolor TaxID=29722 RepID=UPI00258500CE|nr:F-box protein At3g58530 [Amaranthus tricolor]
MENNFNGKGGDPQQLQWTTETLPKVFTIVSSTLPQRDLISLLVVSPWLYHSLSSHSSLWQVLDFHEMNNAGNRLLAALSLPRYKNVKQINLEFAQDIGDNHLELIRNKCPSSLMNLEILNLNGCQKISDKGVEAITSACSHLRVFSIYWNLRVTDVGVQHLVKNCKHVTDLNFSGCKNISDKSMQLVADAYPELESLNITRCIKLSDGGLQYILLQCTSLKSLNLYALCGFTDTVYKNMSLLPHLRFLDLCGAQNLSDQGLMCIAKCSCLVYLNLTWCVRVTDVGVKAIAEGCTFLELLSLFGIVGVTDESLEALAKTCSGTLKTLDVNGCINIQRRTREKLLQLFPLLECFKVHS